MKSEEKTDNPQDIQLDVLLAWKDSAKQSAQKKNWERFVIDQFLRGNQSIKGNPSDNSLTVTRTTESINYPINKLYAVFRAVRGFVTRHYPIITVEPKNSSEQAKTYARRANKILERDNQLNSFQTINKEWAYYGIKYGVGYRQVGFDAEKKCCVRWSIDPCDLLIGNRNGIMQDAPYIIKTVTRTVGYLKHKFPKKANEIQPDNKLADDEYKQLSLQITYQDNASLQTRLEEQTCIVNECLYRTFEKNKEGGTINKVLFIENCILDTCETPYTEYPYIPYKSDIVPNEGCGEGHLKHIISPQRMLNLLNTQLLEYNHLVNRGRFLKDKNSGFRVINAKEGQIIEKNPGKMVTVLNPPGINPLLRDQITMANDYIETIGGQHDASMGTNPTGVTSGDALEALQLGDSNNISDLRSNFEEALAMEAQWILKMYSIYEDEGIELEEKVKEEGKEETRPFAAVGMKALEKSGKKLDRYYMEDNGTYCDVCAILPDNQVKVSVSSQLGETKAARLNILMKLVDMGLPLKVLLEHLEFPNTSDILERVASEAIAEQMTQAMAQPQQGMPTGGPMPTEAPPVPTTPTGEEQVPMPEDMTAELQSLLNEA